MLTYLDAHAGAIQAVTTIVLAVITIIYVVLTKRMSSAAASQAQAAIDQVKILRDQLELNERLLQHQIASAAELKLLDKNRVRESAVRLHSLVADLQRRLTAIPRVSGIPTDKLRQLEGLTESEAEVVRSLSPILGDSGAKVGASTASALQWIAQRFQLLRDIPKGPGAATIGSMFGQQWYPTVEQAEQGLAELRKALEASGLV